MKNYRSSKPTRVSEGCSVQTNLAILPQENRVSLERLVGVFLAHAQVRQLTKSIDIKMKLDNAES